MNPLPSSSFGTPWVIAFGVGKFILASTSSVYGAVIAGPASEDADSSRPLSPYAASKKAIVEHQERHAADPMMTWADIGHAKEVLGWTPTIGIEEGIHHTVEWYTANRAWTRKLT